MQELFRDIGGYESLYQISNLGNVRSFKAVSKGGNLKPVYKEDKLSNLVIEGFVSTPDYTRSSKKDYYTYGYADDSYEELCRLREERMKNLWRPENEFKELLDVDKENAGDVDNDTVHNTDNDGNINNSI